jgi:hypothetical protein
MPDDPSRNLILSLGSFGPLCLQPDEINEEELQRARYVVFAEPIADEKFAVAVEWAAHSQAPIFCTQSDLKRFVREGFGAYRFNTLGGFREVGFEEGSLKFIPARPPRANGLRGILRELADVWGLTARNAFHVVAKSKRGETLLYLNNPFMDRSEWSLLKEDAPRRVYGNPRYPAFYWLALSEKLGTNVEFFARVDSMAGAARKIFPNEAGKAEEKLLKKSLWLPIDRNASSRSSSSLR